MSQEILTDALTADDDEDIEALLVCTLESCLPGINTKGIILEKIKMKKANPEDRTSLLEIALTLIEELRGKLFIVITDHHLGNHENHDGVEIALAAKRAGVRYVLMYTSDVHGLGERRKELDDAGVFIFTKPYNGPLNDFLFSLKDEWLATRPTASPTAGENTEGGSGSA